VKRRIAFVEDERDYREMMSVWLRLQYDVICFENASQFMDAIRQGSRFDLIISDISMPEMSGIEMIECLRSDSSLPRIPAFALTAHTVDGESVRAIAAGFDEYMTKLTAFEDLEARMQKYFDRVVPEASASGTSVV